MSEIPKWSKLLKKIIEENTPDDNRKQKKVEVSIEFLKGIKTTLEAYSDAHKAQEYYAKELKKQIDGQHE
jgi:hypothetical protein